MWWEKGIIASPADLDCSFSPIDLRVDVKVNHLQLVVVTKPEDAGKTLRDTLLSWETLPSPAINRAGWNPAETDMTLAIGRHALAVGKKRGLKIWPE